MFPKPDFLSSHHGRASFSRDRMSLANANAFDACIRALVSPFCQKGTVELQIVTEIVWGRPLLPDWLPQDAEKVQ